MTVNHPTWGNMCEICFCQFTSEDCAIDFDGNKWDIHSGLCALQAGIKEPQTRGNHQCYDEVDFN